MWLFWNFIFSDNFKHSMITGSLPPSHHQSPDVKRKSWNPSLSTSNNQLVGGQETGDNLPTESGALSATAVLDPTISPVVNTDTAKAEALEFICQLNSLRFSQQVISYMAGHWPMYWQVLKLILLIIPPTVIWQRHVVFVVSRKTWHALNMDFCCIFTILSSMYETLESESIYLGLFFFLICFSCILYEYVFLPRNQNKSWFLNVFVRKIDPIFFISRPRPGWTSCGHVCRACSRTCASTVTCARCWQNTTTGPTRANSSTSSSHRSTLHRWNKDWVNDFKYFRYEETA